MKGKTFKKSLPNGHHCPKSTSVKSNGHSVSKANGVKVSKHDDFLAFKANSSNKNSRRPASFKSLIPDLTLYRKLIKKKKPFAPRKIVPDTVVTKSAQDEDQLSKESKTLKKKLKAHLNAVNENIMNPKKSAEEKMAAIGKLMLMAIRFKKHPFEFGPLFNWVKEKHGKDRMSEIKALSTEKLPVPEISSKRKLKALAAKANAKVVKQPMIQSSRRVFTADEKFKLSIGERLYKAREIVPVEKAKLTNLNVPDAPKAPLKSKTVKKEKGVTRNSKTVKKVTKKTVKAKPATKKLQAKARASKPKAKVPRKKVTQIASRVSKRIAKKTIRGKTNRK